MKQCPQCRTTYTDDTLKFCLADGTLLARTDEEETAVRHTVRVDIEPPRTVTVPYAPEPERRGSPMLKIVIAVAVMGVLAMVVAGGAGLLYYVGTGNASNTARSSPSPKPTLSPTASPTVDPEKERLQKELANLQKRLDDEKKANTNRATPPAFPDAEDGRPTAHVNSPNDGFLALRDEPDAEYGTRLAKIPHGAVVFLENCEKERTTIDGRTGRWCMVTYGDDTGWVFDAWLTYDQ